MELAHIGVHRLYALALNVEEFDEEDLRHLDWCTECMEVFRALSQSNRLKSEPQPRIFVTTPEFVS
ncbi:MAG TPA: hypothetical protein VKY31_14050 [Terriglobia bacterium]|nr:hypothetical protein [Terriglobia bacterium]